MHKPGPWTQGRGDARQPKWPDSAKARDETGRPCRVCTEDIGRKCTCAEFCNALACTGARPDA
jgi:hypothetical protein